MAQNPDLAITSIALIVSNLDRSIRFYRDLLGLVQRAGSNDFTSFSTPGADIALWQDTYFADLLGIEAGKTEGHYRRAMIACNLASREMVDEAYARIAAQGVEFLAPPKEFEWNAYAGYFTDPDGNFIELFSWLGDGPLDVVRGTDAPRFPAGRNKLGLTATSVCLFVTDMSRCLDFYTGAMGMEPTRLNMADGFANFSGHGADFSMWDLRWTENSIGYESAKVLSRYQGAVIECQLTSQAAVDDQYQALCSRGVEFVSPPRIHEGGAYRAFFGDPEGNLWSIGAPINNTGKPR